MGCGISLLITFPASVGRDALVPPSIYRNALFLRKNNSAIADNILPPLCKGRDAAVRSTVKTVHRRLFLAKAAKQLCCEPGGNTILA